MKVTLTDARRLMSSGKPWTLRMEFRQNGRSAVWLATGRALHEPVEIHFGAIGAKLSFFVKDWAYVESQVPKKELKGYVYVDTPFVRVQPSTIRGGSGPTPTVPVAPQPLPSVAPWPFVTSVRPQVGGLWDALDMQGGLVGRVSKTTARCWVVDFNIEVVGL